MKEYGLKEIVIDALKLDLRLASQELAKTRYELCEQCPYFNKVNKKCNQCGCYMPVKTKITKAVCPIKTW